MNARQRLALEKYCRFAYEVMNPCFTYRVPTGTVILTVASGHE